MSPQRLLVSALLPPISQAGRRGSCNGTDSNAFGGSEPLFWILLQRGQQAPLWGGSSPLTALGRDIQSLGVWERGRGDRGGRGRCLLLESCERSGWGPGGGCILQVPPPAQILDANNPPPGHPVPPPLPRSTLSDPVGQGLRESSGESSDHPAELVTRFQGWTLVLRMGATLEVGSQEEGRGPLGDQGDGARRRERTREAQHSS